MRIALVHDYLVRFGGAERVLLAMHKLYPQAPIYTLLWDERKMREFFPNAQINSSFLNKFPKVLSRHPRRLLPLIPLAVESLDFSDYDVVISSSSAFIKGIVTRTNTVHICYCHAPSRFLWEASHSYIREKRLPAIARPLSAVFLNYLRIWDLSAASRVDYFLANSRFTASRISKYYRKESKVIYPPLRSINIKPVGNVNIPTHMDYFVIVSQLVSPKRVDLAVWAFKKLEMPLVIIGEGPERNNLEKIAGKGTIFLGCLDDEQVDYVLSKAQGFIFSGEDDFGLAPVEAMSHGKPVLALRRGGATETIVEGLNGEFFDSLDIETLADGVRRMKENILNGKYDQEAIKKHAEQYSEERFGNEFKNILREYCGNKME